MPLKIGSTTVDYVVYNGNIVNTVVCNETTVHESILEFDLLPDDTYAVSMRFTRASINIPRSINGKLVTQLAEYAFDSYDVENVVIPDSVTTIGRQAFSYCEGISNMTIPNSVTYIGVCAFEGCSNLTSVSIGNSVTSIGDAAFYNCSSLKSINIPDSVTSIGANAFTGCIIQNVTMPTSAIFHIPKSNLETVTISSGQSIPMEAFKNCTSLTSITIPDSVTSIGGHAFWACSSLTSITIPDSVTSIGDYAFEGCGLTSVYYGGSMSEWRAISIGNANASLLSASIYCNDGVISPSGNDLEYTSNGDGTCKVSGIGTYPGTNLVIPSIHDGMSVTSIGDEAFRNCSSLVRVTIPDSVTIIGESAFSGCTYLTAVSGCNNLQSVKHNAFFGCQKLVHFSWKPSLTTLGTYAFWDCIAIDITTGLADTSIRHFEGAFFVSDATKVSNRTNVALPQTVKDVADGEFPGTQYLSFPYPSTWRLDYYDETDGEYYEYGSPISITSSNTTQSRVIDVRWYRQDTVTTPMVTLATGDGKISVGVTNPRYATNGASMVIYAANKSSPTAFSQIYTQSFNIGPEATAVYHFADNNYYTIRAVVTISGCSSSTTVTEVNSDYIEIGARQLADGAVSWIATEVVDYLEHGGYGPDQLVAGGYDYNDNGLLVPVLYKTDITGYATDDPDLHETFFYVGQGVIDGSTYDKWIKIEDGTGDDYYTWDSSEQKYIYTNVIVVNNRFISGILL